jgi:hypothetical protein
MSHSRRNSDKKDSSTTTTIGSSFVFKLTGHLTSRFVLCLPVHKIFVYEKLGVEIHTAYCVCIISRFSFFSFFSFSLQQFVEAGGLDFESPLENQDIGFPIQTGLKYLNDMGTKMFRVLVPLYPIESTSSPLGDPEVLSPTIGHKKAMNEGKMIPPVEFQFAVKSIVPGQPSRKVDMVMRRDLQLKYFHSTLNVYSGSMDANEGRSRKSSRDSRTQLEAKLENDRIWEKEESFHVLLWALPVLLRKLPLDQISLAVGCALIEMHVIVLAPDLSVLSSCLLAIVHLLRPLKWVGVVVVTLPESQAEYLDSPVPLIAGVQKLPDHFALSPGVVVVDCQENCVKFHPTDNVTSHKFFLPQTNKLIHSLTKSAEVIYRSPARKASVVARKKSMANLGAAQGTSSGADGSAGGVGAESGCLERQLLPVPVDLDATSEKGHMLMCAVSEFSNTVAGHLQVLVNTAVQSAWEAKQQKYKKRELLLTKSPASPIGGIARQLTASTNARFLGGEITAVRSNSTSLVPSPGSHQRRHSLAVRTVHASVATAAATMRLTTKNWTPNLPMNLSSSNDSIHGDSSVVSSQHDSRGSDSSESLPSIQKGAELFPTKAIGETGLTFVKSLQNTQMFCNYCLVRRQLNKQMRDHLETGTVDSSVEDEDAKAGSDEAKANNDGAAAHGDGTAIDPLLTPTKDGRDSMLSPPTVTPSANGFQETSMDSLVAFFQVLLTGSVPFTASKLETLRLAYEHNEANMDPSLQQSLPTATTSSASSDELEKEIFWCNGRCGGAANTETCTCMCLQLWEQRVKLFTHHLAIKEIVERNRHSVLVLNPIKLDNGEVISLKHSIPTMRHGRETESQYQQRTKLVEQLRHEEALNQAYKLEPVTPHEVDPEVPVIEGRHSYTPVAQRVQKNRIDWGSPVTKMPSPARRSAKLSNSDGDDRGHDRLSNQSNRLGGIYFPPMQPLANGGNGHSALSSKPQQPRRRRLYASDKASPSVKAIARHYVKLQLCRRQGKLKTASMRIYCCLRRNVFLRYFRNRQAAATAIQMVVRGFLLRCNLPLVKMGLVQYKQERHVAAVKLASFFREAVAKREAERDQLITFQRLMNSRSPTQLPIASVDSQRTKGVASRILWSPPTYNPQPLQNPSGSTPTGGVTGTHPVGMVSPPPDNSLAGDTPFQSISGSLSASSKYDSEPVVRLSPSVGNINGPMETIVPTKPSPTLSTAASLFGQMGGGVGVAQSVTMTSTRGQGSSGIAKAGSGESAVPTGSKMRTAASKFSLFNKVFGSNEPTKEKEKDREKAPKSGSAIKFAASSSTKAFNRFSSNSNLMQTGALSAHKTTAAANKAVVEPTVVGRGQLIDRSESKFSVMETDENVGPDTVFLQTLDTETAKGQSAASSAAAGGGKTGGIASGGDIDEVASSKLPAGHFKQPSGSGVGAVQGKGTAKVIPSKTVSIADGA